MNKPLGRQELALEPDFRLGLLLVRPSSCRIQKGDTEIRVEALSMSVLVLLARAEGATITREELINTCWQGRFVSDEAIARTISKVRMLARDVVPLPFLLEAVPKVGYRLILGDVSATTPPPPSTSLPVQLNRRPWLSAAVVAGLLLVGFFSGVALSRRPELADSSDPVAGQPGKGNIHSTDIVDAIMSLSGERLTRYLQAGWNINWTLDTQGTTALTFVPQVCERDAHHDQEGLLKITRLLVASGADAGYRNKWGDTAYVIAREGRYCGPHHPVTEYLRSITPAATADPVEKQLGARTP